MAPKWFIYIFIYLITFFVNISGANFSSFEMTKIVKDDSNLGRKKATKALFPLKERVGSLLKRSEALMKIYSSVTFGSIGPRLLRSGRTLSL